MNYLSSAKYGSHNVLPTKPYQTSTKSNGRRNNRKNTPIHADALSITNWFQISAWLAGSWFYIRVFDQFKYEPTANCWQLMRSNNAAKIFPRHMLRGIYLLILYFSFSRKYFPNSRFYPDTKRRKQHEYSSLLFATRCENWRENLLIVNYACVLCSLFDCIMIQTDSWRAWKREVLNPRVCKSASSF